MLLLTTLFALSSPLSITKLFPVNPLGVLKGFDCDDVLYLVNADCSERLKTQRSSSEVSLDSFISLSLFKLGSITAFLDSCMVLFSISDTAATIFCASNSFLSICSFSILLLLALGSISTIFVCFSPTELIGAPMGFSHCVSNFFGMVMAGYLHFVLSGCFSSWQSLVAATCTFLLPEFSAFERITCAQVLSGHSVT
nr:hypothetical protein Iba_chr09fCG2290 [Ipomoea batatas]